MIWRVCFLANHVSWVMHNYSSRKIRTVDGSSFDIKNSGGKIFMSDNALFEMIWKSISAISEWALLSHELWFCQCRWLGSQISDQLKISTSDHEAYFGCFHCHRHWVYYPLFAAVAATLKFKVVWNYTKLALLSIKAYTGRAKEIQPKTCTHWKLNLGLLDHHTNTLLTELS